jgi:hypothetical protein
MATPEEWLKALGTPLDARRRDLVVLNDYFDGKHPTAFATAKWREAFGSLFSAFADNWCERIVYASGERLRVQGFRFGGEGEEGDSEAAEIWQRNNLDQGSRIAQTEAIKLGTAYLLVDRDDDGKALITTEHPFEMILQHAPGNRRKVVAGLKKWVDVDSGFVFANVYLPEGAHKFKSDRTAADMQQGAEVQWKPRQEGPAANPVEGVVPIVALENNPSMLGGGRSDLRPVLPVQDAINKLATDMIVASEYAGYRQRWATGVEIPDDPETGKPLNREKWLSAVSRMWTVEDADAKFGEFDVTPLKNYVDAIEMLVQHLAAQTSTPPHYLLGQVVNASGDALKAAEAALTRKVVAKQDDFAEGYEDAMRLAFRVEGNEKKAGEVKAETLWRDAEVRTEGERVDALVKMRTLGVPLEALWARWGATPQEIEDWKRLSGLPDRPPPGATTTATAPPGGPAATTSGPGGPQPDPAATAGT